MSYSLISADIPWSYSNGGNGAAKNHYPTMTNAQIASLPVAALAAPDCVLLMWATWPHLKFAMQLIDRYGFTYVTGLPWIKTTTPPVIDLFGELVAKPTYGTGFWVRGCSEPILIAKRGKASPDIGDLVGLLAERILEHSRKPEDIYELAEALVPLAPEPEPVSHLEMFARRRRPRWDVFGHVEGSIALPETAVRPSPSQRRIGYWSRGRRKTEGVSR